MMTTVLSPIAAWLLTYLVHSTLLLGGVALLTRYVVKRESLRDTLWKTALLGAVVTATAAMAVPRPAVARIDVAALGFATAANGPAADALRTGGTTAAAEPAVGASEPGPRELAGSEPEPGVSHPDIAAEGGANTAAAGVAPGPASEAGAGSAPDRIEDAGAPMGAGGASGDVAAGPARLVAAGLSVWAVVVALLLFRLSYRHVRLRWLLRDRVQVAGTDRAASALTELRRTAGVWKPVRLTTSSWVATPLALGGVEICVPDRFLTELGENEQRAALAHELAHLARRDPVWQLAGSVLGAVFFFQPLNAVARRAIRSAAEYLADGWAVAQTGSRVELARCLAAVAGWVAPSNEPALAGTVAMAEGGSPLLARVQRLLEHEPESATRPALRAAVAAGMIVAVAGFAPVVGAATESAADGSSPGSQTADAGPDGAIQDPVEVRRFDGPALEGDGFVARLNAAERDARQTPHWVAYAMSSVEGSGRVVIDSDPWRFRELEGAALASVLGVEDALVGAGAYPVLVLARLVPQGSSTRLDRLTVRHPELGMPIGGPVYWLGAADPSESFRWLRDIYGAVRDPDVREAVVEAIAVHATPETEAFLHRVLAEDRDTAAREEAMSGLALRPDTALARLFFDLALSDPSEDIRREATEHLGDMRLPLVVPLLERLALESSHPEVLHQAAESLAEVGTPEAAAALARLLESHPSREVRREALEQLSELDGGLSGEAMLAMAITEDDPDLRREAVERLEELPPDQAVALLRRAAFESGDGTVERQAAESLGAVGTQAALRVLVEILERNPSEDASFQAVESIAENYPRDVVIPVLREVLSRHSSSRVRREALDALGDLGG